MTKLSISSLFTLIFFPALCFLATLFLAESSWSKNNTVVAHYEYESEHPDEIIKAMSVSAAEQREIEKKILGKVSVFLSDGNSRIETTKVITHHVSHGDIYKQFDAMPVKDEAVQKMLQDLEAKVKVGTHVHTKTKIELESVDEQAQLTIDLKAEKINSNEAEVSKKQKYKERRKAAKECISGVYDYRGSVNRQLVGCGLLKKIESKRLIKTGETDSFLISSSTSEDEKETSESRNACDYYELATPPTQSEFGGVVDMKVCIAFHDDLPIVYLKEDTLKTRSGSTVKTSYKLTNLNFDNTPEKQLFDFEKNAVCSGDIKEKKSC